MNKIVIQKTLKFFIIFSLIIFVSCSNFTTPKKITIQADPEIQVPFGSIETSLSEYFSIETIQSLLGDNDSVKIYDYKYDKNDDNLRFLANMDYSMVIDGLDIESYLQELESLAPINFGYEEDNITPSVLFSIPQINETIEIPAISLEFNDNIRNSIKNEFSAISFSGVEPGVNIEQQTLPMLIELCDDEFDSITFGSGTTLNFNFLQLENYSSGLTAIINSVSIVDAQKISDGKPISEGGVVDFTKLSSLTDQDKIAYKTANADLVNGENLSIEMDMEGKTIPKDIGIILNVSFSGGVAGHNLTVNTSNSKFENMNITKVCGFTTVSPIEVDLPNIEPVEGLGSDFDYLKGAKIGSNKNDGFIGFNFGNLPEGITINPKLSINQDSIEYNSVIYQGLNVFNVPLENDIISLAGQSFNTKPITFSGKIELSAIDAEIDFTKPLELNTYVNISKFESISIEDSILPTDQLKQTHTFPLGEISSFVNRISFTEVGLKLAICNGLPLDATMKLSSNFLGIDERENTFSGNQTELTEPTNITSGSKEKPLEMSLDETTVFDITIDISLPSSDGIITIPNVVAGSDYSFFGKAELVADWKSINFKLPDDYSGFKGSFPEEGGEPLDFSAFTQILGEDISFSGINAKLYFSSALLEEDGPFAGADINGTIKVSYIENGEEKSKYFIGSESEKQKLNITKFPELNPTEEFLVINPLKDPSLQIEELSEILFSGASNIKFEYDIQLGSSTGDGSDLSTGIEIQKESLDKLSERSEIKIGMFIDLPICLNVKPNEKGYAAIDLMSLLKGLDNIGDSEDTDGDDDISTPINPSDDTKPKEETDLFKRAPGEEIPLLDTIFDYIEKVSINIDYKNNTGIKLSAVIKDENDKGQSFEQIIDLSKQSASLNLTFDYEDAEYIKNTNPFYPDVLEIQFPGDKTENTLYPLKRNADVSLFLQGNIETDIDYTINLDGNSENPEGGN